MRWGTNGMGGAWVLIGGPMRWGTNEMGDQWDGGPLGLAENGWTNEKGDQWEGGPMSSNNVVGDLWTGGPMRRGPMRWGTNESGGPMRWGTNEMSGAWVLIGGSMRWGTNEMGNQWDGEPMRWGTNEMGDQWCAPDITSEWVIKFTSLSWTADSKVQNNKILHTALQRLSLYALSKTQIARFMGPTWAHLDPVSPRWAPFWPNEPCYQGIADL